MRSLGVHNALRALPESVLEERYYICRLAGELVCKFFVVRYQVRNIDITVVLLHEDVFSYLVSVDIGSVQLESKDELFEFGLDFCSWFDGRVLERCEYAQRVRRSCVHSGRRSS